MASPSRGPGPAGPHDRQERPVSPCPNFHPGQPGEASMTDTVGLLEPLRTTAEGGLLSVEAPWHAAERLGAHPRRRGLRAPLPLAPARRQARLVCWPGTDPDALRAALASWGG